MFPELQQPAPRVVSGRFWRAAMRGILLLLSQTFAAGYSSAQNPALTPTADLSIIVSGGVLHYSLIHIPPGVTVRCIVPPNTWPIPFVPAVVLCDGDAIMHGTLSVGAPTIVGYGYPAGAVNTGAGLPGQQCGTIGGAGYFYWPPTGGRHAGTYGTVVPFSLEGGSPGGWLDRYGPGCWPQLSTQYEGMPGGTLVLLAQGRIEVGGAVTGDGDHLGPWSSGNGSSGGGSGGSILLRGAAGVTVLAGGRVTARGGRDTQSLPVTFGAPGYVRLDAYGSTPVIQGTVDPPPTVLELPHLRTQSPPQIGTTWILDVLAPENAPIIVAVSLQAGPGTMTPFGVLGIDLALAGSLGLTAAQPSHDPIASMPLPVPNVSGLIGLQLWVQGIVVPQTLAPRLTNTLATVVN